MIFGHDVLVNYGFFRDSLATCYTHFTSGPLNEAVACRALRIQRENGDGDQFRLDMRLFQPAAAHGFRFPHQTSRACMVPELLGPGEPRRRVDL